MTEQQEKRNAAKGYKFERQCRTGDLDKLPSPTKDDILPSYPMGVDVTNPYTDEDGQFKIRRQYADGHHPNDRWNLQDSQIGAGTAHEHDDWKRSPPEVLDQDPAPARAGYLSNYRVPDSRSVYEQTPGGDQLGLSPDQRAKRRPSQMTDGM